jgi:hypothetical protein
LPIILSLEISRLKNLEINVSLPVIDQITNVFLPPEFSAGLKEK